MAEILAIIINWNELSMTERCVASLLKQENAKCDIFVIDNNSIDDPTEALQKKFPQITIIRNNENLGVAGGRNIGIRYALENNYPYLLLFDNDAYAHSNMLYSLRNAASINFSAGVFGPKILCDDDVDIIWHAGCISWKLTYLHTFFRVLKPMLGMLDKYFSLSLDPGRGANKKDEGQYDQERDIAFQIGCAQFIRTDVFRDIGLLDEEFIPYGSEDIDFCARTTRAGWKIRYIPEAICRHRIGGSFRDDYNRTYYNAKNLLLLARKNLSYFYFWLCFLPDFVLLTVPLMLMRSFVKKNKQHRKAFIDALIWNCKDIIQRGVLIRETY